MKKYPYVKEIPVMEIVPNTFNPNVMSDTQMDFLLDNIADVGFINPLVVVQDGELYTVIDGEHRLEAAKAGQMKTVSCVVVDPDVFDEKCRRLQCVKMNNIRGAFDTGRFNALVKDLMTTYDMPFDELYQELAFEDEDEFLRLVDETRRSLPAECRKDFDKKVKKVKTPDELLKLAEALLLHYNSETVGANFMVFQYEGTNTIVVNLDAEQFKIIEAKCKEIQEKNLTVDTVIANVLGSIDMEKYIVGLETDG